jgi:hypothetical protein
MFLGGAALGLMASQIGNVNMSSVGKDKTSEVGGLQGVFQNLGSSLGTALIGSVLISALTTTVVSNVSASSLPNTVQSTITQKSQSGVPIVAVSDVSKIAQQNGLSVGEAQELATIYSDSQVEALRTAFFALTVIAALSLLFSRNIPDTITEA